MVACLGLGRVPRLRRARGAAALDHRPAVGAEVAGGLRVEVVATGIPRPIQLAFDARGRLAVLSHGWRGDAAGEIYRVDLDAPLPVDLARAPRVVIPFADGPRKTVLGSLAIDVSSGDLFLGEENGNRIYRLGADQRLQAVAVGLNHLLGGSALDSRPPGTAGVPRLRESGNASPIGDAPAAIAQLAHRRGLSRPAGLSRRPARGPSAAPARRPPHTDPSPRRSQSGGQGASSGASSVWRPCRTTSSC